MFALIMKFLSLSLYWSISLELLSPAPIITEIFIIFLRKFLHSARFDRKFLFIKIEIRLFLCSLTSAIVGLDSSYYRFNYRAGEKFFSLTIERLRDKKKKLFFVHYIMY